jgi:hypothetical protein
MNWRNAVLLVVVLAVAAIVFLFPAIPQSEAYHNFADRRTLLGIPNCLDVLSNCFFLAFGLLGIRFVMSKTRQDHSTFVDPAERAAYLLFFVAVAATAFGSAYYHLRPDDNRLLWDRLPMAVGFLALVAAVVCERTNTKSGIWYLIVLPCWGAWTVWYWHLTQANGRGDLRPYIIAQFGSLLAILLLIALFPARYTRGGDLVAALAFYALAKVFETADRPIFALGEIVSGHTLKHVAAAISAYWILRMLRLRRPVPYATEAVAR